MWKRKKKVEKFKSFGWENMSRFSDSFTRTSSMCYTRCSSATSKTPSEMWAQRNTTAAATSAASCQNKRKNVLLQNFFFFSFPLVSSHPEKTKKEKSSPTLSRSVASNSATTKRTTTRSWHSICCCSQRGNLWSKSITRQVYNVSNLIYISRRSSCLFFRDCY